MKIIKSVCIVLLSACLTSLAEDGAKLNSEGQLYSGLNIGYLHSAGWRVLAGPNDFPTKEAEVVQIDEGGVRIGKQWLGQIFFDDGKLKIKNKDRRHQLLNGKCELGFIRAKIIMDDGGIIYFGKPTCL